MAIRRGRGTRIPSFEPSITNVKVYGRKLSFIRDIWPAQSIQHLAPRAALLVNGAVFQKMARLDASKLKRKDGVKYLGQLAGEEKLHREGDLPDRSETNSYLTRHDTTTFEELPNGGVSVYS